MKPTVLPRKLWKSGQRVWWIYNTYDEGPIASTGTVVSRPADFTRNTNGVMIRPDHPLTDTFWVWDFVIRGGTGRTSPLYVLED